MNEEICYICGKPVKDTFLVRERMGRPDERVRHVGSMCISEALASVDEYEFSAVEVLEQLPVEILIDAYTELDAALTYQRSQGQNEPLDNFAYRCARKACLSVLGYLPGEE